MSLSAAAEALATRSKRCIDRSFLSPVLTGSRFGGEVLFDRGEEGLVLTVLLVDVRPNRILLDRLWIDFTPCHFFHRFAHHVLLLRG